MTTSQTPANTSPAQSAAPVTPELGRNEPCHCGSGKKFKRCHGVNAAPKLGAAKPMFDPSSMPAGMGGFDPSKLDSNMMTQFAQMMGRLPKGQLQKLQSIMQRAMKGEDVTREAQEFEKTMPVELQQLMVGLAGQMGAMGAQGGVAPQTEAVSGEMSEEEARRIVEAAAKEGKISSEMASELLSHEGSTETSTSEVTSKKLGRLWKGLTGKKS